MYQEPNFYTAKCFSEDRIAIVIRKTEVYMNKPIYLRQAILDISKMYTFHYDYLKPKYNDKVKLCYMDGYSFIIHIEPEDFYKDIANDVDEWFDTSGFNKEIDRPIAKDKNKNIQGMFKDELNEEVMIESTNVRAKLYAFLRNDSSKGKVSEKKAKGTKKCIIKKQLTYEDFKNAVIDNKTTKRKQLRFRSDHHYVFTEETNKIAISPNDDKRILSHHGTTSYQYGSPKLMMIKE